MNGRIILNLRDANVLSFLSNLVESLLEAAAVTAVVTVIKSQVHWSP
ncbi:hypothetical protein M3629_09085 [Paenibacillus polysaccharolyticus]|nr:hypothetical protein [Paenibacillus polysaccharolyticus]